MLNTEGDVHPELHQEEGWLGNIKQESNKAQMESPTSPSVPLLASCMCYFSYFLLLEGGDLLCSLLR